MHMINKTQRCIKQHNNLNKSLEKLNLSGIDIDQGRRRRVAVGASTVTFCSYYYDKPPRSIDRCRISQCTVMPPPAL